MKLRQNSHPSLPKNSKQLLCTPSTCAYNVKTVAGGEYFHFGIQAHIAKCVVTRVEQMKLKVNVDGLPLFKSSGLQFWPILGMFDGVDVEPFLIGLYCGFSKPTNANEFLQDFVTEAKQLYSEGVQHGDSVLPFSISSIICDAPARAFVKCTKNFSGYSGCDKCVQSGTWINGIKYPLTDAPLRTDGTFALMEDEDHHVSKTILSELPLGLVSKVPLDYMHFLCLGVTRKLLLLWMKGPLPTRQPSRVIKNISDAYVSQKTHYPAEFARRPRPLSDIDRWKATEFREFLLYGGPLAICANIPDQLYQHFLLLFVAIRILASPSLCYTSVSYTHLTLPTKRIV